MYISPTMIRIIGMLMFLCSIAIVLKLMHDDTMSSDLRKFLDILAVALAVIAVFIIT